MTSYDKMGGVERTMSKLGFHWCGGAGAGAGGGSAESTVAQQGLDLGP